MGVEKVDHIYVECQDFAKNVAFWEGLGFKLVAQWGEAGHVAGRLVSAGACVVLAEATEPVGPNVHFAIDDAVALNTSLQAADAVEVVAPLEDTHWGTRWIRVHDPEGRLFVLEGPAAEQAHHRRPASASRQEVAPGRRPSD